MHETRYESGNQKLVPEKALETDVSIHYHGKDFTFEIAGFYNIVNDFIFLSPTADTISGGSHIYRYLQSNALLYGLETDLHLHLEQLKWLHFETTFASVTGKLDKGGYLPFIPANKFHFELRLEKEKFGKLINPFIKLNSQLVLDQNKTGLEETNTAGYTLFDCGIGVGIKAGKQKISLGISLNNIFDRKYVDHLSTLKEVNYFNPGRNFILSLKIPFGIK
jgi:iron complex outermembrane receptor protein